MSRRAWNRGSAVRVKLDDGSLVKGQVWEEGEDPYVWVALDDGRYARIFLATDAVQVCDALGQPTGTAGKVAA